MHAHAYINLNPKPRKVILWNKADISTIKEITAQFSEKIFNKFSISTPIDILWDKFKSLYSRCVSLIPTKPFRTSNNQPWISFYIRVNVFAKSNVFIIQQNNIIVHINGKTTETLKK